MDAPQYQGILFPDRAENLGEKAFEGYRVFLDFWDPLAAQLRSFYEALALRRDSRAVVVYGPQGSGKTLFARKLADDFKTTARDVTSIAATPDNLWHRITGGTVIGSAGGKLEAGLIADATLKTAILSVESDKNWVKTATEWAGANQDRRCIVVMDNAERNYFLQGLVALDDADYLQLADTPKTAALASERFVALCRKELRGCLFVMLTNNDLFALSLDEHVNAQHQGLMTMTSLPLPGSQEKETVVRVNTNRLNRISYWFCLDKAGPDEKMAVYTALRGASTFPGSFAAVDNAIKLASPTRMGRPARKCMLTLVVLSNFDDVPGDVLGQIGVMERVEFDHSWLGIWLYEGKWARPALDRNEDAGLLESEWQLRVVAIGKPFVGALLSDDNSKLQKCGDLLKVVERIHGPGSRQSTRDGTASELRTIVDSWPTQTSPEESFWSLGQTRSQIYEAALGRVYSNYNLGGSGFLTYRPDLIISPYVPCSILSAPSGNIDHINDAIRREAHVFEFTAMKSVTTDAIQAYLRLKLPNYVMVNREQ